MFPQVVAIGKIDNCVIEGILIWRDNESFGLEYNMCGSTATITCYYDEWDLCYNEDFTFIF